MGGRYQISLYHFPKFLFVSTAKWAQWYSGNLSHFIKDEIKVYNNLIINIIKHNTFNILLNLIQYTTEWHSLYDRIRFRIRLYFRPTLFVNNTDYYSALVSAGNRWKRHTEIRYLPPVTDNWFNTRQKNKTSPNVEAIRMYIFNQKLLNK